MRCGGWCCCVARPNRCYLCHCGDCAHDERGAATSDRARFQRRQARDPDGVRGRSSHGRRCWGRTKRAADVCRRPEIDRETPCRRRCPAPSAEDRSEKPVDRISGRRHLRGRHPAHRSRCRPGIFAEQHQDGGQAEIGIQQALSRPPGYCDAADGRRSFVGALAVFARETQTHGHLRAQPSKIRRQGVNFEPSRDGEHTPCA